MSERENVGDWVSQSKSGQLNILQKSMNFTEKFYYQNTAVNCPYFQIQMYLSIMEMSF